MNHKVNIIVLIISVFLICSCIKNKDDDEDKIVEGISSGSDKVLRVIFGVIAIIVFIMINYVIFKIISWPFRAPFKSSDD